ncbi:MAG: putative photosynthetic complex assembly protein PuhE [Pseudomonadota bacterium]
MAWFWPVPVAVGLWWLSTLTLLWRLRLPAKTYPNTLRAVSAILALGIICISISSDRADAMGALLAFIGALAIWSWHEASYFFGIISGPRPRACPPNATAWQRFRYGVKASLYHELLIVLTAIALFALLRNTENQIAAQAFVVLWLMRWSTKLNIFVGVNNLHSKFWPDHLRYLESYVGAAVNRVFPLSLMLAAALAFWLLQPVLSSQYSQFDIVSASLLLTLLALAIVEHVFLLVRVPDDALWSLSKKN